MRVLFLSAAYIPNVGGIERLLQRMCRQLRERGHEVMVVAADGDGVDVIDGVSVCRTRVDRAIRTRDIRELHRLQRWMSRVHDDFAPDVVHSHDIGPLLWNWQRATRHSPAPVVVTVHTVMTEHLDLSEDSFGAIGRMLEDATVVTAVSQHAANDTLTYAPSIADRMRVLLNGVDAPPVGDAPVVEGRLLAVGRLVRQKGFDTAITALARVAERVPSAHLLIVGDGEERRSLEAHAAAVGVSDRIEFAGQVEPDEVRQMMQRCVAVVMPSRYEGLPLVALEAAWAGRPVVGSTVSGLSEAVVDGVTGILVPPDDPEALVTALVGVLGDDVMTARLGAAARERAKALYDFGRCLNEYEALYRELMQGVVTK